VAEIRILSADELVPATDLVRRVFEEYVRPDLDEGGWDKVLEYVDADAAQARVSDHVTLGAFEGAMLVGVIEIRHLSHVSILVVEGTHFGRGIARQLLERGLSLSRKADPSLERVTVNASRYAMEAYRRMGFVEIGEEMVVDGIRFTPMALEVLEG